MKISGIKYGSYEAIQRFVKENYGFTAQTCWIAHVLEINGHPPRVAHNRKKAEVRERLCTPEKRVAIEAALRHFNRI